MCVATEKYSGSTHATNPDCWIGVDDPKKRKQIQDRLAQRARRRRLARARAEATGSSGATSSPDRGELVRQNHIFPSDPPTPAVISNSGHLYTPNLTSQISIPLNVFSALWKNGEVLGLTCSYGVHAVSKDLGPGLPLSLQPTALQLMTAHPSWIDRFPFPLMRDNMISLLGIIDMEDFLRDIFTMSAFTLKPTGAPWDSSCWTIEKNFREKWGFLFDPNLF